MEDAGVQKPSKFLTDEQKQQIIAFSAQKLKMSEIATKLNISARQVRTVIAENKRGKSQKFTKDEDLMIIMLFNRGITKECEMIKYIPSKAAWMVRNRIALLKRKGIISAERQFNLGDTDIWVDRF